MFLRIYLLHSYLLSCINSYCCFMAGEDYKVFNRKLCSWHIFQSDWWFRYTLFSWGGDHSFWPKFCSSSFNFYFLFIFQKSLTSSFVLQVDNLIRKEHLFKESIILIKAWSYYESRILGSQHGLLSTYGLEILIIYLFNIYSHTLAGPLEVTNFFAFMYILLFA